MSETGVKLRYGRSGVFAPVLCAIVIALLAQSAAGQSGPQTGPLSPFALRLTSNLTWDANVFRVSNSAPDPQATLGISGKSDYFATTTVGLLFDKVYSQQHFVASANQSAIRYHKFSSLDRDASDYRAAWLWQLTPRISGTLSTEHQQSAVAFEDFIAGRRLVKTVSDSRRFSIDGWLFGGWHLLAGVTKAEYKTSEVFLAVPGSNLTTDEFGLRYISTSGSSITATSRSSRGIYPGQNGNLDTLIDTGFKVQEKEVAGTWIASMHSTLSGRLTRTERRYDHFNQLDFAGVGGEFRFSWTPTGRLLLSASALRNLTPYFQTASGTTAGSGHRVEDVFAFTPVWQVTNKISLNMTATRSVTDYPVLGGLVAGPSRRDTTRRLSFGANWALHPKVNLGANLQRDERSSNVPGFDYLDTILGVTASVTY